MTSHSLIHTLLIRSHPSFADSSADDCCETLGRESRGDGNDGGVIDLAGRILSCLYDSI